MADSKSDSIINEHFATKAGDNPLRQSLVQHLDNALWQYACRIYSQAGMEAALLDLQDEHGADINLILQALWLASEGLEWTPQCITDDYDKWVKEQVIPIRTMRRSLKTDWVEQRDEGFEDFRQQVKRLELQAEQYALAMLFLSGDQLGAIKGEIDSQNSQLINHNLNRLAEHFVITEKNFDILIGLI